MRLQTLLSECDPPAEVRAILDELIEQKSVTRELGSAPLPAPISEFVDREFEIAAEAFPKPPGPIDPARQDAAERFFRRMLDHVWRR